MQMLDISNIFLEEGPHVGPEFGGCILEWVSFVVGEPWSDRLHRVSPVIQSILINWNDGSSAEDRQQLKRYIPIINSEGKITSPGIMNTNTGVDDYLTCSWMAYDWLIRVYLPACLRLIGLKDDSEALESLPTLIDRSLDDKISSIYRTVNLDIENLRLTKGTFDVNLAAWLIIGQSIREATFETSIFNDGQPWSDVCGNREVSWWACSLAMSVGFIKNYTEKDASRLYLKLQESAHKLIGEMIMVSGDRLINNKGLDNNLEDTLHMAPTIRKILDLSTAHLPQHLGSNLAILPITSVDGVNCQALEFGWFMWVPDNPEEYNADFGFSPDLALITRIQRYARSYDCDYVLFDADASRDEALPTWEW